MAIEVFWISGSPFAWRVLLALEMKRQVYRSVLIERSKNEQKSPEFLAMNPRGRVPVLRDGEYVVHESLAILAYIERRFANPPLFGRTAEEAGQIWQWVAEHLMDVDPRMEEYILPLYFGQWRERADVMHAAVPKIKEYLARVEETLSRRSWLVGDSISAADVVVFPTVKSLERAAGKEGAASFELNLIPLSSRYPAISSWTAAIERLPGYENTYPPHWR
jgi:glutathione S-transferase